MYMYIYIYMSLYICHYIVCAQVTMYEAVVWSILHPNGKSTLF